MERTPVPRRPDDLTPSRVQGIHPEPLRGREAGLRRAACWQNYHMDGHGWSDTGYQVAVDQDGNRYGLRCLAVQSGANGDEDLNERFDAALLILAPVRGPRRDGRRGPQRHRRPRRLFPGSRRIVGHAQVRPEATACPGPAAMRLIGSGGFEPTNHPAGTTWHSAGAGALRRSTRSGGRVICSWWTAQEKAPANPSQRGPVSLWRTPGPAHAARHRLDPFGHYPPAPNQESQFSIPRHACPENWLES